jgi:1-acyl-sn-glycerol-3-phosphate acyltransferase
VRRLPELTPLPEDETTPSAVHAANALAALLERWFRFRVRGLENVPPGPCLLVANHSAGALFEILLLVRVWQTRLGARPARGLAHRAFWRRPLRWLGVARVGALPAEPDVARRALSRGYSLLVFPGGELEVFRPFGARDRVDFAGRTGFVRLARREGVPIVPVAISGSHAAYVVLPGARRAARWTGLDRALGLKAFPLTVGVLAAFLTAALPLLAPAAWLAALVPLPTRIEAEVLPPLLVGAHEGTRHAAARVEHEIQAAVDRMASRRRTPWG